jgi:hypothetical protein
MVSHSCFLCTVGYYDGDVCNTRIWNYFQSLGTIDISTKVSRIRMMKTKSFYVHLALTIYSPVVTICNTSCNVQKFCVLPTMHVSVLRGSENKEELFLYTALNYRFYNRGRVFTVRYGLGL